MTWHYYDVQGCHGGICHPGICGVQPGAEKGCCYCLSATSTAGRYRLVETDNNPILQIHHYNCTVHHGRSEMLCTSRNLGSTHSSNASAATLAPSFSNGGPCCQEHHLLSASARPSQASCMHIVMADRMALCSDWYTSACMYALQIMSFPACDSIASRCEGGYCLCSLLVFWVRFSCSYWRQWCFLHCLLDKPMSFV